MNILTKFVSNVNCFLPLSLQVLNKTLTIYLNDLDNGKSTLETNTFNYITNTNDKVVCIFSEKSFNNLIISNLIRQGISEKIRLLVFHIGVRKYKEQLSNTKYTFVPIS